MVSVLVPVYNVSPYIEKCARSLFEQTFSDIEFVFVDDCSPDESMSILYNVIADYPELDKRVKIIHNNVNMGLATVRNIAVRTAEGDFILHVDSDDWIEPYTIELMVAKAEAENADLVICDFNEVRKSGNRILENRYFSDPELYTKSLLRRKSLTHIIGKLIKRSILTDNKIFTEDGLNQGEDYLVTPKIAYHASRIAKVDLPLYNYNRLNVNSYTANVSDKGIQNIIEVQNRLIEYFSSIPDADKYKETVEESCIYNKLTCFYSAPYSSYSKISRLYPDIHWKRFNLKQRQKAILYLSDKNALILIYIITSLINRLHS